MRRVVVVMACLALPLMGCGSAWSGGAGSAGGGSLRPDGPASELRRALFVHNVRRAMEEQARFAALGELLAWSLCRAADTDCGGGSYLERLGRLGPAPALRAARGLAVPPLELALALRAAQASRQAFERKLREWAPEILRAAHRIYAEAASRELQAQLERILAAGVGGGQELHPGASVGELASGLPDDDSVLAQLKVLLRSLGTIDEGFDRTAAARLMSRLQKLSRRDVAATRESVRKLIGSPDLPPEEKGKRLAAETYKADAALDLTGIVVDKLLGHPREARALVTVGKAMVSATRTIANFGLGRIGADLATMNVVGLAADLLGGLLSVGPDEQTLRHQELLASLAEIRADTAALRRRMQERFDRVDARLQEVLSRLEAQLELLRRQSARLEEVHRGIAGLGREIVGLAWLASQGFNDLLDHDFRVDFDSCLGPASLAAGPLGGVSAEKAADCESRFYGRAVSGSRLPIRSGEAIYQGLLRESADPWLAARKALESPRSELRLGLLSALLAEATGKSPAEGDAAYVMDWISGADAYVRMRVLAPGGAGGRGSQAIQDIERAGYSIRARILELGGIDPLRGVLDRYQARLKQALARTAPPGEAPCDELEALRLLLERLMFLHAPERAEEPGLGNVFAARLGLGLPSGDEVREWLGSPADALGAERLGRLRARAAAASDALRLHFLEQEIRGLRRPASTVVDGPLERLSALRSL